MVNGFKVQKSFGCDKNHFVQKIKRSQQVTRVSLIVSSMKLKMTLRIQMKDVEEAKIM
jgi:hypothetical protein